MENKLNLTFGSSHDFEIKYNQVENSFDFNIPHLITNLNTDEARILIAFINTHICYIPDKNTISALAYCDERGLGAYGGRLMEGALWLRELIGKRIGTEIPACKLPVKSRRNLKQYISKFNIKDPFEVDKIGFDEDVEYCVDLQWFKFKTEKEAVEMAEMFNKMFKRMF